MKANIYFDNAATTPIDPRVVDAMIPILRENYGNPSSIHKEGRVSRSIIERARKQVASYFNASPSEFFFTSGGTEADNMILRCSVHDLGVKHIITSPLEHHAVLHTAEELRDIDGIRLSLVKVDKKGKVDLEHLRELLDSGDKTLVSLMHANNEIATRLPLKQVGEMCKEFDALFHSDTVQTMGHYSFDFKDINIHFATCSAHKFHGPKGIGFLYVQNSVSLKPMITGGSQERNMRAGTENIYGIVGLTKALELAYEDLAGHQKHIQQLKSYMIQRLKAVIPDVHFNGDSESEDSLYTVLSVCFPSTEIDEMLLYHLDIQGVSASGGSACSSGSNIGSHVLSAIGASADRPSVRFSFGRFNTKEEIDSCIEVLEKIFVKSA
ncbi:MAG: cysteine desulfurase [Bacteroidetes bacterium]|nr:MAG: cysteine desulfurase [Bacteroidota bacterium]MBL1144505.1 cysteine desulfurase [Bacteroidota bacterium]MCB0801543.1 cysteine desulfurase [Flavobacteriales bacterium]NOG57300.1 cysteine desulfurase [Bacteroidota bacterium]